MIDGKAPHDLGKRYQQQAHQGGHTLLTANNELHGARASTVFQVRRTLQVPRTPLPFASLMGCVGTTYLPPSLFPGPPALLVTIPGSMTLYSLLPKNKSLGDNSTVLNVS